METVRNPISLALVKKYGSTFWFHKPDFSLYGPFDSLIEAENALEKFLYNEFLTEPV